MPHNLTLAALKEHFHGRREQRRDQKMLHVDRAIEPFEFIRGNVSTLMAEIIYGNEKYFKSFHEALSIVAKERIYIEMIDHAFSANTLQHRTHDFRKFIFAESKE